MKSYPMPVMTDVEIVDKLSKCDPVRHVGIGKESKPQCSLCGSAGLHGDENIRHNHDCPWIHAMKSRDPYGPGGKWDRRKCTKCGSITADGLDSSRICADCK